MLKERWIKDGFEYALLTNKVYSIWLWVSGWASEYRNMKWIKKTANLRDHMDNLEIALVDLAEAWSQKIMEEKWSKWFEEVQDAVTIWSWIAWNYRKTIEKQIIPDAKIQNKQDNDISNTNKQVVQEKKI
jgi:hypothetical protein